MHSSCSTAVQKNRLCEKQNHSQICVYIKMCKWPMSNRPFAVERRILVVVLVSSVADILFRIFIKGLLTARRAEVIGLSFIFRLSGRGRGVNVHATYGIFYCSCHLF